MYNHHILENCGTIKFVPNSCKNQEMCNKAVDNYLYALEFVKAQEICGKAVNTCPSTIQFVLECYTAQEICDKAVNTYIFVPW